MLWFLFACTVGPPDHPTPDSAHATEVAAMAETQTRAGRLAGHARELEAAAQLARKRIAAGGDPKAELATIERLMQEMESMEQALKTEHADRVERIRTTAQSTPDTTE